MPETYSTCVHVVALSENGVLCSTAESSGWLMWLPRRRPHAEWVNGDPKVGDFATVILPGMSPENTSNLQVPSSSSVGCVRTSPSH